MSKRNKTPVLVTGCAWEIPGFAGRSSLERAFAQGLNGDLQFDPEQQLGKKGLRYKERSTLLALCAAKAALADAGWALPPGTTLADPGFGVVVASNTGNLDTVCGAADTIRREHVNATSSMDLPNASSNVVASSIAIRFGLKALNLMVCSGSSASLDALVLAANAIRNGRAERMLVVAVETDGKALRSLLAGARLDELPALPGPLLEGAAAVVLESHASAQARAARLDAQLTDYAFAHADATAHPPLFGLLDRHQNRPRYFDPDSFLKRLQDEGFGTFVGPSIELGPLLAQSYGSGTLLQLVHHLERCRADAGVAAAGALLSGGGAWQDRRGGLLAVEAGGTP